jgi:transketolase C-terminal domain/subunit
MMRVRGAALRGVQVVRWGGVGGDGGGEQVIHQKYPDVFVQSGIMERGNFSAAAGFGMTKERQGVFSTFAAFQEMVISEVTMARLNYCNVLCHFSHSGCDDMADNSCHFGLNNFFADNGVEEQHTTRLYFPADSLQLEKVVESIFWDEGLRFLYTTRSKVPLIQREDGSHFFGEGYRSAPAIRPARRGAFDAYTSC